MSMLGQRSDVGEFRRRFRWHALVIVLAFLVLIGRLFFLQVIAGDEYQAAARENIVRRTTLATTRGVIRDSQGRVLATSRPSYNVFVVPGRVIERKFTCITQTDVWSRLVDFMHLAGEERAVAERKLNDICSDPANDPKARKFQQFLLREDVGRDVVAVLETHEIDLKGVDVVPVPVRSYPYGELELASHTLGYMAEIDGELLPRLRSFGYIEGDRHGAAGVEGKWESYLRGARGWEKAIVDARGARKTRPEDERLLDEPRRLDPVPGRDLRLTLDIELVEAIDKAMRGQVAGAAVVVDVRTGRVLALYSKPSFDPNVLSGAFGKKAIQEAFNRLYKDTLKPTLDKTMSGAYPPGSTYKPFSALSALDDLDASKPGVPIWDPKTQVQCRGFISYGKYGGRIFRCTHVHGHIDMRQAIVESCNVYFYEVAKVLHLDGLARRGLEFGFGQKTGIGVNPEAQGRIPTTAWYTMRYRGQVYGGFALNAAIGQGATTVTVLQLALAYAALANGGTLYQPQIVRAVETSDGAIVQDFPPRVKRRITIRPEHLDLVRSALHGVVNEPEGTAYHERFPDVDVSGKTGTAQASHRRFATEDNQSTWYFNRDHAWFAGYAPASAPEIAFAVIIEHGGVGAKSAGPVAFSAVREYQRLAEQRLATKSANRGTGPVKPPGPPSKAP